MGTLKQSNMGSVPGSYRAEETDGAFPLSHPDADPANTRYRHAKRKWSAEDIQSLCDTLMLLLALRAQTPYRSKAFYKIDSACWYLRNSFFESIEHGAGKR